MDFLVYVLTMPTDKVFSGDKHYLCVGKTMSLLVEYRATEGSIKALQERLQLLSQDDHLQKELEFEKKLRALMDDYQKSLADVRSLFNPQQSLGKPGRLTKDADAYSTRRARKIKQYRNPHTGEIIETKGGNHKLLKQWKSQWGANTVESWATTLA